jgi:hypothetical protein
VEPMFIFIILLISRLMQILCCIIAQRGNMCKLLFHRVLWCQTWRVLTGLASLEGRIIATALHKRLMLE